MPEKRTGWERSNRKHFDDIVANYDRIRPSYPAELIADVISYAGPPAGKIALEIGAGTGKATKPFLDAGFAVTAVELGANMAEFLEQRFAAYSGFNVVNDAFEDVTLEEDSYNLIYAASAFHWVNAEVGCPKAFRLLRSGGAIALFRYNMIPAIGDSLYEAIQAAYDRHYLSHYTSNNRPIKRVREDFYTTALIKIGYGFQDLADYGFSEVKMKLYDATLVYNTDEYIALLDTLSDHRNLPEGNRLALYAEIREALLSHGDRYENQHVFQAYLGKKP